MGLVVLLLPGVPDELKLGAQSMATLARLGITSAALVRDVDTVGLVLEGWAFDPSRSHEAATAVGVSSVATLKTLVQMAVSAATNEGAHDEKEAHTVADGGLAARAR